MLFYRVPLILRPLQMLSKKVIFANEIGKREFNETCCSFYRTPSDAPKKPPNPYLRFFHSILPELEAKYPDISYRDKTKMSKNLWESLDLDKKRQYFFAYYEELDRFKFAKLQYECEQQHKRKIGENFVIMTKEEKKLLKKLRKISGIPKKNPSAFSLFLVTKKNLLPKESAANWIKDAAKEYRNLSEDDRKKFKDEAEKLNDEYREKISEWENSLIKTGHTDLLFKRSRFLKEVT